MRVCLLPLKVQVRNPVRNMRHFRERMEGLQPLKPDLICLPECAFTGYLYTGEDLQRFAEPVPGPTVEAMAGLARRYRTWLCFGLLEQTAEGVYNAAVLLDRQGLLRHRHRKNVEKPPFLRGSEAATVESEFGRLGILICGDLFDEEVVARLGRPRFLIVPMARSFDGRSPDRARWEQEERRVYLEAARRAGCLTLFINLLEDTADDASFGGALVASERGELLAESPHGSDEVLVYDLSPAKGEPE
ncbi:MAG: carbon-nitrogen hydrolase family protein [Chloroflexia bacterium]